MYITELSTAHSTDYKNMLIQGIMSNLWYDQQTTLNSLKNSNNLDNVFNFILTNVDKMTKDFEIKRVVIGLASVNLTTNMPPPQELMPKSDQIMKAIVFLSHRSIELKEKKLKAKHEEALVDKDCE